MHSFTHAQTCIYSAYARSLVPTVEKTIIETENFTAQEMYLLRFEL